MGNSNLSRREVLSALAAAGGAGTLAGGATSGLLADEETLSSDAIGASTSVAGVVDLDVTPVDGERTGFRITLPDDTSGTAGPASNNPARVWVRTKACPEPAGLADSVTVKLLLECDETRELAREETVFDVFTSDDLREGVRLDCPGADCLQPGDSRTLVVERTGTTGGSADGEAPTVDLLFYGQQCRYGEGRGSPFDPARVLEPDACSPSTSSSGSCHAISWVGLCGPDVEDGDVTLDVKAGDGDGPLVLGWSVSGASVDVMTWKVGGHGGGEVRKRSVSDESGTLVWDDGEVAPDLDNPDYCPGEGVKFEYDHDTAFGEPTGTVDVEPVLEDRRLCGDVTLFDDVTVRDTVVEGELTLDLEGTDRVVVGDGAVVQGDLLGPLGDDDSGGVVELNGATVEERVFTGDATVELGGGTTVGGDLTVDGDGRFECTGEATIDGETCSEYTEDYER